MTHVLSDQDLVVEVLNGRQEAFAVLVERHQDRVLGHVQRMIGPRDADDITQDSFIRAYNKISYYKPQYRFISWLLVISSRLALNHLRNEKPHRLPHVDDCQVAAGGLGPARQIENEDQATYVARCLDRVLSTMNEKARLLYELKFRQELSLEEMAEHLACSVSAVKVRVHRLRKSLQEALREDMEVLL